MNKKKSGSNLLHKREERVFFLYRNYLLKDTLDDSRDVISSEELNFSNDQIDFILSILDNIENLEKKINEFSPDDWEWERFNFIEKAILLNGVAEITLKENKREIVINESVEFAKKYCGEKAPSLINAILDKIKIK